MSEISYNQFSAVSILSGTIVDVKKFPKARKPAYKIWVDFGPKIGILQTSAQVTDLYTIETLLGLQVMGCINLGTKNIGGFISEFLLLGFSNTEDHISLATIDQKVPNGQKLH